MRTIWNGPKSIILFVMIAFPFLAIAGDGVKIESLNTFYEEGKVNKETSTIWVGDESLRIDTKHEGKMQTIIFKDNEEVMYVIDHSNKTYQKLTKEQIQQMSAQLKEARAKMEEQMENMPPEQRKQMKKMMNGKMMGSSEPISYEKTGEHSTIKEWDCEEYLGYQEDAKVEQAWVASTGDLDITESQWETLQAPVEFMKSISEEVLRFLPATADQATEGVNSFEGFPIKRTYYKNGSKHLVSEVQSIDQTTVNDSKFTVPEGYKEQQTTTGQNPYQGR